MINNSQSNIPVLNVSNNVGLTPFKLKPHQRTSHIAAAAAQFEATFYQSLVKQLFESGEDESNGIFGKSAQGNFIKTLFVDVISKMGSSTLGMQKAIEKSLGAKNQNAYGNKNGNNLSLGSIHDARI